MFGGEESHRVCHVLRLSGVSLRDGLAHLGADSLRQGGGHINEEKITNPGNKTIYRIYDKETHMLRADLICFVDEVYDPEEDLLLFDPNATWKKTLLKGGTYTMKELLQPIFIHGECKYESPSVKEIAAFCKEEKATLWDETKRLFNPHKVYVDLSQKLYDTKTELLNEAHK